MKPTQLIITLLLMLVFILTFFVEAEADPSVTVAWLINCENGYKADGFMDRGFCVPGVITSKTHYVTSPSRFWGVGSSYAPGVMERMCERNEGCGGFKDGVAVMSCGDIGRTAWIKVADNRPWYGPLKVVDCSQPFHAYVNVAVYGLAVEWGHKTTLALDLPADSAVRIHLGGKPSDDEWGWNYARWWIDYALEFEEFNVLTSKMLFNRLWTIKLWFMRPLFYFRTPF